jgi:NADPH:quinone reductase-like Zn-dependent oxidoreductase
MVYIHHADRQTSGSDQNHYCSKKAGVFMIKPEEIINRQTCIDKNRFAIKGDEPLMKAVITTGNGGLEVLEYRDVPIPTIQEGEVLIQVLAAGVNNTEINTRIGWYSSSVTASTEDWSEDQEEEAVQKEDGGWSDPTPFPFIQGTDCCGIVVKAAAGTDQGLIGKRVLVRSCMRPYGFQSKINTWMASDFDGAFAQYVKVPASEVFPIDCSWSDAELGSIPCSYGAAENMIHRAQVSAGDVVLVTGTSGGVGSAAVQLAKRRGAKVIAEDVYHFSSIKADNDRFEKELSLLRSIGADQVIREGNILDNIAEESVDVVIDNVSGPTFDELTRAMKRGGRYASSGAIAGPLVTLDKRTFYLKDLTLIGCTAWDEPVFPNLVSYIERGEIKPVVAKTFPLEKIREAQAEFLEKKHVGKFVLIPPAVK